MFKKIILIVSCVILVACSQLNSEKSPQALAPPSLTNKTLSLDITDTTGPIVLEGKKTGVLISYFKDQNFLADLTDMGALSVTGTYSYQSDRTNKASLTQTMAMFLTKEKRELRISTELNFLQKNSGTFVSEVYDNNKLFLQHTGNFSVSNKPVNILPDGLNNKKIKLDVQSIETSLPVAHFSKDIQFYIAFDLNNDSALDLEGNFRYVSHHFSVSQVDPLNQVITGTFTENNLPYRMNLTFGSLIDGTFTLDLDNGKTKATGYFYLRNHTPMVYTKLKGSLTETNFNSKITHIDYPYSVYLPPGYQTSGKSYPIIYITDGQWQKNFSSLLDYYNKEAIMVAIEQGPGNSRREVDFLMPGATEYIRFLKEEFSPMIEAKYRTNYQRTYFGHSYGGELGSNLIRQEQGDKPFFKNYILSDSDFLNLVSDLAVSEGVDQNINSKLPIKILLSTGMSFDKDYVSRFLNRNYQNISVVYKKFDLLHEEIAPPTFIYYMDQID